MFPNRSRYEGRSALQPPVHIQRSLERRGGRNRLGEPMYRLVWTPGRVIMSWGIWHDWPKGTPVTFRNPDDPNCRPWRSVLEGRPVPVYLNVDPCWSLERWLAPEKFGSEFMWNQPEERGGTYHYAKQPSGKGQWVPRNGPYPCWGDYDETSYFFQNGELSEAVVLHTVGLIECGLLALPESPFQRAMLATGKAISDEDAKYDAYGKWCAEQLGDDNVFDTWSVGGQAEAHKLARSIGINSQIW